MKTLLLLAKGVETIEMSVYIDVMGWARDLFKLDTQLVTCGLRKEIISTFRIPITVDMLIEEIHVDDYDALAIPGGFGQYGFYEDAHSEPFLELIREFNRKGKIISSICVGSLPIAKSGVLKGRKGTTYHLNGGKRQKQLAELGVEVINEPIVKDGNIITSYCPQTAFGVAFLLLEMLTSPEEALQVKEAMGF